MNDGNHKLIGIDEFRKMGLEFDSSKMGMCTDSAIVNYFPNDPKLNHICNLLSQCMICDQDMKTVDEVFNKARLLGYYEAWQEFACVRQEVDNKTLLERSIQGTSQQKAVMSKKTKPKPVTNFEIVKEILTDKFTNAQICQNKKQELIRVLQLEWENHSKKTEPTSFYENINRLKKGLVSN